MKAITMILLTLFLPSLVGCGGGSGSAEPTPVQVDPPPQTFSMPDHFSYRLQEQGQTIERSGYGVASSDKSMIAFVPETISNGASVSPMIVDIISVDGDHNITALFTVYDYHSHVMEMQFEAELTRNDDIWTATINYNGANYDLEINGHREPLPNISIDEISGDWETVYYEGINLIYSYPVINNGQLSGSDENGCLISGTVEHDYKNIFKLNINLTDCDYEGFYSGNFYANEKDTYYRLHGVAGNDSYSVMIDVRAYK
jgi:hypothetical protein